MKILTSLMVLLMGAITSIGQNQIQNLPNDSTLNPCPGGTATVEIDPVGGTPTLDQLVRTSQLIVVGSVVNVLPAFNPDPHHLNIVETDSMISVEQLLYGALPSGMRTVLLNQEGGTVGPCGMIVPDDPLVKNGEQYVLFLRIDDRLEPPNTSGSPRYFAVGVWSGKAKVVNGKMQFLPRASADLHTHDNADATVFIEILKEKINGLLPRK